MKCPCEDEMYLCETPCNMESCAYQQGKNDGRAEAVEDFANALIDGEQNEEFVYNIKEIIARLKR